MTSAVVFDKSIKAESSVALSALEKLESLLAKSKRILLQVRSVFPFDFFPDEITIDEYKVNIVSHIFFWSKDIHSIAIDSIRDIEVETSPFFATLKIVPDGYPNHPLEVHYLWKKEAIRARKIIQGLMVARKNGLNSEHLESEGLAEKVEALGGTNLTE